MQQPTTFQRSTSIPPPPPPSPPPNVQRYLSPAVLAYLFKEEFKIYDYSSTVGVMTAATLYSLLQANCIRIYPGKRGRIFKKDTVMVYKQAYFDPGFYGYLSYKISNLPIGKEISVYDVVLDPKKKGSLDYPQSYVIEQVLEHDLSPVTWNFLFYIEVRKVKRSLLDKILLIPGEFKTRKLIKEHAEYYRPQALKLKRLFHYYVSTNPVLYKMIEDDCSKALSDMEYVETEDFY